MTLRPAPGARPPSQRMIMAPRVIKWLALLLIAIHLFRMLLPVGADIWILSSFAFDSSLYADAAAWRARPLAALMGPATHMLLHIDLLHLGVNTALLMAFGTPVARRMGGWWFLLFFLLGGLAGMATMLLLYPGTEILMIGASGAVSACMGAVGRLGLRRNADAAMLGPFRDRRTVIFFVAFWVVSNFLFGLFGPILLGVDAEIAWEAHLGGFLAGVLLIGLFDGRGAGNMWTDDNLDGN